MRRRVVLVSGPPCAGKTSLVAALAAPGDLVADLDAIAVDLGSPVHWEHRPEHSRPAERRMRQHEDALARGAPGPAWVIRVLAEPDRRQARARYLGAELLVVDPGLDVVLARAKERSSRATYAAIRRWYRLNDGGADVGRFTHKSAEYQRARTLMFEIWGDTCHLCNHRGAGEADHLKPVSLDPLQGPSPYVMRPAHGTSCPCPTCGRKCNQERRAKPLEESSATSSRPEPDWTSAVEW